MISIQSCKLSATKPTATRPRRVANRKDSLEIRNIHSRRECLACVECGYKDSTRQWRVVEIPSGFNICNKRTKLKKESHRDSMFFNYCIESMVKKKVVPVIVITFQNLVFDS